MNPTKQRRKSGLVLHIGIFLLLAGSSIYLLFRQKVLFLSWISPDILALIHVSTPEPNSNILIYMLLYCFPDGLWYAALLILQSSLVNQEKTGKIMLLLSMLLPFMLEFAQLFELIPGTFDCYDLITYLIILILFIPCAKKLLFN